MKRIIYSNYVKFIAFILCALSMAASSYLVTSNFLKEDNIYFFESSFEESYFAKKAVNEEFNSLSRSLANTADEKGVLHPEKIQYAPSPNDWECYIKADGGLYKNTKTDENFESFSLSELSGGVRVKTEEGQNTPSRETFSNNGGNDYYFLRNSNNNYYNYELCVRMGEQKKEESRLLWQEMKNNAERMLKAVTALFIFAAALFIYLLCVTGRKYDEAEVQMMLADKMFVEITAALFLIILIGGGTLTALGAVYLFAERNIFITNQLTAASVFGVVSLSMLLLLSLVRNLKNGTFAQRSLIVKICKWIWQTAKRIVSFLVKTLKKILGGIKNVLSEMKQTMHTVSAENFGGRFVSIMIVGFAICVFILTVLTMTTAMFIIILILFVVWAVVYVSKRLIGFEKIKEGLEKIKDGDLNHKITDCPEGIFSAMADNINSIGGGLQKSLEREIKAEKMKSELITNVSHDLKTPLTSIINYAELLSKENLMPEEANDYVKIILQKGERLKQLTNDLFDISKVQSGNEKFNIEDIDICLLINQTMAELNESIKKSGLSFKVASSKKEVFVKADGRKMSRVFENLFVNCVKYSMKNTRVYINVTDDNQNVKVEIKNIAGYEMDFDETEIAERFVRGDSARTSEGSGLGLAIVKSYVEGCGGSVDIKKDGDLFKVIIYFVK